MVVPVRAALAHASYRVRGITGALASSPSGRRHSRCSSGATHHMWIQRLDPALNAVVDLRAHDALAEARAVDRSRPTDRPAARSSGTGEGPGGCRGHADP